MILDSLKDRHSDIVKQAFAGLMARAAKTIVKNPLKSIGAGLSTAFATHSTVSGTQQLNRLTAGGHNMAAGVGRINM